MKISLQWINDYVDLSDLSAETIAHELTMKTVEVEGLSYQKEAYDKIVVGEILELKAHPNADKLKVVIVDTGAGEPAQIVCGGCNLAEGQRVVVALPGSYVKWHGEGEAVMIKATKLRGVASAGMICASSELELEELFPAAEESEIMDLKDFDFPSGTAIAKALGLDDVILDIDNKSLTNRPDLWGHYGLARELAAIFKRELKNISDFGLDQSLKNNQHSLPITIEAPESCLRYAGLVFSGVDAQKAPYWLQKRLISTGISSHSCLIDITNYVMLATGCPTHGFDRRFVKNEIRIRKAKKGESLELLDDNYLELTPADLVICDQTEPMALAGVKGGKKDSLHEDTTEMVLEVAIFDAITIRRTAQRFNLRTEASTRYEKAIDTKRADMAITLACQMIMDCFPQAKLLGYQDEIARETEAKIIKVELKKLAKSLGQDVDCDQVESLLFALGFKVKNIDGNLLEITAPSWRSTGDIESFYDIVEEYARITGYENFAFIAPRVSLEKAVKQDAFAMERRIREYLAFRCGFREIFTYPWVADNLLKASGLTSQINLAQPPAPDQKSLRPSLVPGLIGNIKSNLRFNQLIRVFEAAQVFLPGEKRPSEEKEILPQQKLYLSAALADKEGNGELVFRQLKGILEDLPRYAVTCPLEFQRVKKAPWLDDEVWLNILSQGEVIGSLGLLARRAMNTADIKRSQIAVFEIDLSGLEALPTRDNSYKKLPLYPLVEEDFAIVIDDSISWQEIETTISPMVKDIFYMEEYRGSQIPAGKKSLLFHVLLGSEKGTLSTEQIAGKRAAIIKLLKNKYEAALRQ